MFACADYFLNISTYLRPPHATPNMLSAFHYDLVVIVYALKYL